MNITRPLLSLSRRPLYIDNQKLYSYDQARIQEGEVHGVRTILKKFLNDNILILAVVNFSYTHIIIFDFAAK